VPSRPRGLYLRAIAGAGPLPVGPARSHVIGLYGRAGHNLHGGAHRDAHARGSWRPAVGANCMHPGAAVAMTWWCAEPGPGDNG